jgi:hypothetical protein
MSVRKRVKAKRFVKISLHLGIEGLFSDSLFDILAVLLLHRYLFIERDFVQLLQLFFDPLIFDPFLLELLYPLTCPFRCFGVRLRDILFHVIFCFFTGLFVKENGLLTFVHLPKEEIIESLFRKVLVFFQRSHDVSVLTFVYRGAQFVCS